MKFNIRNIILSICWGIMSSVMGYSVKTAQGAVVFCFGHGYYFNFGAPTEKVI
jgi:hypothetical protein